MGRRSFAALVDCDCFCLPSRQEGFSLAVTEAMACRSPVVISTSCHFPEVREAGAGVITDLNATDIADGLMTVLGTHEQASMMGKAGRELVTSRFTWPSVAGQMIRAYDATSLSGRSRTDFADAFHRGTSLLGLAAPSSRSVRALAPEARRQCRASTAAIQRVDGPNHAIDFPFAVEIHFPASVQPAERAVAAHNPVRDLVGPRDQPALDAGEPEKIPIFRMDVGENPS